MNEMYVYNQLKSNPQFEACTMSKDMRWIRLQGKAVFDCSTEAKAKVFEVMPGREKIYKSAEFEVFYVAEAEATFYSLQDAPRTIKL